MNKNKSSMTKLVAVPKFSGKNGN